MASGFLRDPSAQKPVKPKCSPLPLPRGADVAKFGFCTADTLSALRTDAYACSYGMAGAGVAISSSSVLASVAPAS